MTPDELAKLSITELHRKMLADTSLLETPIVNRLRQTLPARMATNHDFYLLTTLPEARLRTKCTK